MQHHDFRQKYVVLVLFTDSYSSYYIVNVFVDDNKLSKKGLLQQKPNRNALFARRIEIGVRQPLIISLLQSQVFARLLSTGVYMVKSPQNNVRIDLILHIILYSFSRFFRPNREPLKLFCLMSLSKAAPALIPYLKTILLFVTRWNVVR